MSTATTSKRPNLNWHQPWCKQCGVCVGVCPTQNLKLEQGEIIETGKCTRCQMCVKYCPDQVLSLLEQE